MADTPADFIEKELKTRLEEIGGCGDGSCVVYVRPGQHTNGGCRCLRNDKYKAERVIYAYKQAMAGMRRYINVLENTYVK